MAILYQLQHRLLPSKSTVINTYSFAVLLFLCVLSVHAQTTEKAFTKDLVISIQGDSIAANALIAKGTNLKETVVLLHGLPGNEKNLDLAEFLRQRGKNVIYFNYRGSWGSQGQFRYTHCLEDIANVLDYLNSQTIAEQLRIKRNAFTLIGHSLGGGIAVLHGMKDSRVQRIIALSAFNVGAVLKNNNSVAELQEFQNYLRAQFMLNINPTDFLKELLQHKQQWDLSRMTSTQHRPALLFIDENSRNTQWIQNMQHSEHHIIPSDHSFSDKRLALNKFILQWLHKH